MCVTNFINRNNCYLIVSSLERNALMSANTIFNVFLHIFHYLLMIILTFLKKLLYKKEINVKVKDFVEQKNLHRSTSAIIINTSICLWMSSLKKKKKENKKI